MAEIMKTSNGAWVMGENDLILYSLADLSRLKMQEQEKDGTLFEKCIGIEMLYGIYPLPALQCALGEKQSLAYNESLPSNKHPLQRVVELDKAALPSQITDENNFSPASLPVKGLSLLSGNLSEGFSETGRKSVQENKVSGVMLPLSDSASEFLCIEADGEPELRKESFSANISKRLDTAEKGAEGAGGEFIPIESEVFSENQDLPLPQKNEFVMEYDLPSDISSAEGDNTPSERFLGGEKLTYNFKTWGEGHSVNVRLGHPDDESQLQFEPSEGLVEQRLTELWERTDLPEHWSLQNEEGSKQQQQHQPETDDEEEFE